MQEIRCMSVQIPEIGKGPNAGPGNSPAVSRLDKKGRENWWTVPYELKLGKWQWSSCPGSLELTCRPPPSSKKKVTGPHKICQFFIRPLLKHMATIRKQTKQSYQTKKCTKTKPSLHLTISKTADYSVLEERVVLKPSPPITFPRLIHSKYP